MVQASCVTLCSSRQVMVTNVTSLLKTVKAVEDEATRGTRALEATIEYVKQELTVRATGQDEWESSEETQPPRQSRLRRGRGYRRLLFPRKQGSLFFFLFFFFPLLLSVWLISSPSVPAGFSLLLSGSGEEMQAEQEKQEDLCNLLFVI